MAAFDLRSASLHLSQYIETSSSYQNTKTLLQFYDPVVLIVPPNKLAPEGMVGVSELVDKFYSAVKKVKLAYNLLLSLKCSFILCSLFICIWLIFLQFRSMCYCHFCVSL